MRRGRPLTRPSATLSPLRGERRNLGARSADEGPQFSIRPSTVLSVFLVLVLIAPKGFSESEQDRRTDLGIRFFGTVVAADIDLQKKTAPDGKLLLLIYYHADARRAEELAKDMRLTPSGEPKKLGGLDIVVETTNDPTFRAYGSRPHVGIFIAEPPPKATLRSIIQYGITHRIIVYSPFEGHVESGVHGGLAVGAQMKPYVNAATLHASQISLKPFFMKVAKVYQ